jgi:hypothetical protein
VHDTLHVLELAAFSRDAARDLLGQIRMASRPNVDAIHERLRLRTLTAEPDRERVALLGREVGCVDHHRRLTPPSALLEVFAGGDAGEREGEPYVVGLARAPLVAHVDRRE